MDPKELDNIIDAAKGTTKADSATAVAVADPAADLKTVDDPGETKDMPAITTPTEDKPASETAEAVAKTEAEKAEAERIEKEKEEAAKQIKAAEEAAKEVAEEAAKEAAEKEAARWAQPGTPDTTANQSAKGTVNVLEMGLKKLVGAISTTTFDGVMDEFKEVMDNLNDAIKASSGNDLELKVIRQDVDFSKVRYELQLHENRSGDDTCKLEWCFIDIPWVTGYPMKITPRGRRSREAADSIDRVALEAFFGQEFKLEESPVVLACLKYQTKKELKF